MGRRFAILYLANRQPGIGSYILEKYEASLGRHRVSVRFGLGELRKDLEAYASGSAMIDTLAIELLSYQWCKIDDTWAESSHQGVSRVGLVTQQVTVGGFHAAALPDH